jgi:hypothetical protein
LPELALNLNAATMNLSNVLHNRQTKAGASHLTTPPLIYAVKTLKEAGKMRALDSRPRVSDHTPNIFPLSVS